MSRGSIRQRLGKAATPLFMLRARWTRAMTFGVRVAALRGDGQVFLVEHTYVPGWYLPGGAVDPGETAREAAVRELLEEGSIEAGEDLELLGLFQNREVSVRDHVAFYVTRQFHQVAERKPDLEIAACGFFPLDDLPAGTTDATRRRLDEIAGRRKPDAYW